MHTASGNVARQLGFIPEATAAVEIAVTALFRSRPRASANSSAPTPPSEVPRPPRPVGHRRSWCFATSLMLMASSVAGCPDPDADGPDPDGQYATTVHPILSQRCRTCHSRESTEPYIGPGQFGDPDLSVSFSAALEFVYAGDASSSLLFVSVSGDEPTMPPSMGYYDDGLTESELAAIRDWIDNGATGD